MRGTQRELEGIIGKMNSWYNAYQKRGFGKIVPISTRGRKKGSRVKCLRCGGLGHYQKNCKAHPDDLR